MTIEYTANIPDFDSSPSSNAIPISFILANLYLTASSQYATFLSASTAPSMQDSSSSSPSYLSSDSLYPAFAATKKKYKPVALKVRPVIADLPDRFRIIRNITGDPLEHMPKLNPHPPTFSPSPRYSLERKAIIDKNHPGDFLWPEERNLMHDFIRNQEKGFAWSDNERGSLRPDFFPPIEFPVIPHTPWVQRNIPIPPGIYEEVCGMIKKKIEAGVYEPSNSSYRSRWFCVTKKDGKSLRPVHSLEPLNKVTIQHSGVVPIPEHLAEQFGGRSCGGMLDLYVAYDERKVAESSRDLTTFQTPFGALRLVTLPMGWTNSVPIMHDDVTHILQPEIPHITIPYIDDAPIKGPKSRYQLPGGAYETIPENSAIRRFVWEHFENLNRVIQRMKYCGGTFSGHKLYLCVPEIIVLGHRCNIEGRMADPTRIDAVNKWGPCKSLTEVKAFLGTIGVCRIFIQNFAKRAAALINLTRKDVPFEFGLTHIAAQEDLKLALLNSPAIRAIDYTSSAPVILSVDTSHIAVGFFLAQCDPDNPRKRYYSRFGSITLNDRESRFSQPKLELYGLYRALGALRLYLIGVRNIIVEVDARYIKGMLANPDIAPSASINRWIVSILTFHFTLVHVPGTHHGPDGLSRRPPQEQDDEPSINEDFGDWIDRLHGFVHQINPLSTRPFPSHSLQPTFALPTDLSKGEDITYEDIPRSERAKKDDERLLRVQKWLQDMLRPPELSESDYATFVRYCTEFFVDSGKLWRKDSHGAHKIVAIPQRRLDIIRAAHDDIGHKMIFATKSLIALRFWWPNMKHDIAWFIRTCHICQLRQTRNLLIPPIVATPAPLFGKVYMDTMQMPLSGGFKYIVQGRCSLTTYPEWRKLRRENATTLGDWIFEEIICRWGSLYEVVTDNGTAFVAAMEYLAKRYHINHIRISGYNSRANGLVERAHFDIRQSLFKAVDGDQSKWSEGAHSVFWAERVTVRKRMGCSPYFAVTGSHPLIPLDISEATYLQPPPDSILSTTDLIARRAIALQKRSADLEKLYSKVYTARLDAAKRFELVHKRTMRDYNFEKGDLVLLRNTQIEKSLNRKMRPRYLGPLIVIERNFGGAYIICELDGSVFHRPVAAFRLLPYLARKSIPLPPNFLDIDSERLEALRKTSDVDEDIDEDFPDPEDD
jgi:Integrase zinc binding domain/RNase H-like domain found in reverse transcriptase